MSEEKIEKYEQEIVAPPMPRPPEAIYDLTTSDRTRLVKAAGPLERGENP